MGKRIGGGGGNIQLFEVAKFLMYSLSSRGLVSNTSFLYLIKNTKT